MSAAPVEVRDYGAPIRSAVARPRRKWNARGMAVGVGLLAAGLVSGLVLGIPSGGTPAPAAPETAGPTSYEAGVPIGYAPTDEGAIAAAEGFVSLFGTPWVLDRADLEAAFSIVGHPSARNALTVTARSVQEATSAALLAGGADPVDVVVRVAPVAASIVSRSEASVTVRVWTVTVDAVGGTRPAEARWGQSRVDLVWAEDDWKVLAIARDTETPVPRQPVAANVTEALPEVLRDSEGAP